MPKKTKLSIESRGRLLRETWQVSKRTSFQIIRSYNRRRNFSKPLRSLVLESNNQELLKGVVPNIFLILPRVFLLSVKFCDLSLLNIRKCFYLTSFEKFFFEQNEIISNGVLSNEPFF